MTDSTLDKQLPSPDWRKQAFDFLADSTKQLITVATGVVTATVIFSKDLDSYARFWALASWVVLTVSVLFGIAVLFNMSGNLYNSAEGKYKAPDLRASGIRFFSGGQLLSFLLGIGLVIIFGFTAARVASPTEAQPITVNCVVPSPTRLTAPPATTPTPPRDNPTEGSQEGTVIPQP